MLVLMRPQFVQTFLFLLVNYHLIELTTASVLGCQRKGETRSHAGCCPYLPCQSRGWCFPDHIIRSSESSRLARISKGSEDPKLTICTGRNARGKLDGVCAP